MNVFFLSHGSTYSADTGGKIRTYELNRSLSKNNSIFQLSINPFLVDRMIRISPFRININENYEEVVFNSFLLTVYSFLSKVFKFPQEIYLNKVIRLHKFQFMQQLNKSDICITSSPWLTEWVFQCIKDKKSLIYAPADVLFDFYKNIQNNTNLLEKIKSIEKNTLIKASHVITVSEEDKKRLMELYSIDAKKISVIPNGVNIKKFDGVKKLKNEYKRLFKIENKRVVLFVGGKHYPSIQATKFIERIAKKLNDVLFYIVGGAGKPSSSYENVIYTGMVDDILPYFSIADLAINPITTGTGSNIKLLEYLASGIPCVSTKCGIRATQLKNRKEILIAENESHFVERITDLFENDSLKRSITESGKRAVEKYDWEILAQKLEETLKKFLKSGVT